jgi:hypothetical protein
MGQVFQEGWERKGAEPVRAGKEWGVKPKKPTRREEREEEGYGRTRAGISLGGKEPIVDEEGEAKG